MKSEHIGEALNHLSQNLVEETLSFRHKRKKKPHFWIPVLWGAACVGLIAGIVLWGRGKVVPPYKADTDPLLANTESIEYDAEGNDPIQDIQYAPEHTEDTTEFMGSIPSKHLLFAPQYPKMPMYPSGEEGASYDFYDTQWKWYEEREQIYEPVKDFRIPQSFMDFYRRTAQKFLQNEENNPIYSPVNLYLALSMLGELTADTTREEILTLLGEDTIEAVRENAAAIWLSNYSDDGVLTCRLGNSLWIREDMTYEEESLATLAEIYYAATYSGYMGSEEFNKELQSWINEHTGGLLQNQAGELAFDDRTIAALVSAIHFQASWENPFSPERTTLREFYGKNETVNMEFLHSQEIDTIYYGENFTACKLPMSMGTAMWFFLPYEGVSPRELLEQEAIYELPTYGASVEAKTVDLSLYLPKFDVMGKADLKNGLMKLGITKVFDPLESDFTPLTKETNGIHVTKVEHCARVKIDEEGCEAAAYVYMPMDGLGAMEPPETVELVFDRPFAFVVTGRAEQPLFTGIVDQG